MFLRSPQMLTNLKYNNEMNMCDAFRNVDGLRVEANNSVLFIAARCVRLWKEEKS